MSDNINSNKNSIRASIAWSMRQYPIGWGLTTLFLGSAVLDTLDRDVFPQSITCHAIEQKDTHPNNGFYIRIGTQNEDTVIELPQGTDAPQYFVCEAK